VVVVGVANTLPSLRPPPDLEDRRGVAIATILHPLLHRRRRTIASLRSKIDLLPAVTDRMIHMLSMMIHFILPYRAHWRVRVCLSAFASRGGTMSTFRMFLVQLSVFILNWLNLLWRLTLCFFFVSWDWKYF